MTLLPLVLAGSLGKHLTECCGRCSVFLCNLEGAGDDGLGVFIQRVTKHLLQGDCVNAAGTVSFQVTL